MKSGLREARERAGKTQAEVARAAGVAEAMYQRYEYGSALPRVDKALRIARSLGATVEALFGEAEKRPAP